MAHVQFNFPTIILFGNGARSLLGPRLQERGIRRPFLVTDRGVLQQAFFGETCESLKKLGLSSGVYSGFQGNPRECHVTEGAALLQSHAADAIIGVGGGAAIDVAKAIAVKSSHPGNLFDYEDRKDARPINGEVPFIVSVPTTAGTGSEVGRSAVISDDSTGIKRIIFSPRLMPGLVIADPELTVGLPAEVTAATGMDALSHCLEAFLSKGYHPMCDGIALEGIRLISKSLPAAVENPSDLHARSGMLMAAIMGAVAFQKGLGVTHSCAHALSAVYDLHHGLANGIMMPYCMNFNRVSDEEKFVVLARIVRSDSSDGSAFVDWTRDVGRRIGIPVRLSDVKVEVTDRLVDVAFRDPCHQSNPREVSRDDFRRLFHEAR